MEKEGADQKKPKADKAAAKPEEGEKDDKPKVDLNLDVKESFDEPNYKDIAPDGELNLYKVSINNF